MRPVEDAALRIPDVLAAELDRVALPQRLDAPGEINVVRDENREAVNVQKETLMARSLGVVAEQFRDRAGPFDRNVAGVRAICVGEPPRFCVVRKNYGCDEQKRDCRRELAFPSSSHGRMLPRRRA